MTTSPDLVVIGGGIAGVSVAYELAATRRVLLLEAEPELGKHSTARSAAMWISGNGGVVVRALITASGPRFAALATELDTPPLLAPRPVVHVAADDEAEAALATMLDEQAGEPGAPVPLTTAEVERVCPLLAPGRVRAAAIVEDAADIDTDALHAAYVRGLRARGGEVRRAARVTALRRYGSGWQITAGVDEIAAGEVVDAAGAWADELAGLAGVPLIGLQPKRRTAAIVRVPEPKGRAPMVADAADRFYAKTEGDDLLVSPCDETPSAPVDARPEDLDVALAIERVEEVTALGLRSVRASWAGLRSFVADRAPVIGAWPEHPGFWFVAGQGGSGIETSPALSALAAAVITGVAPPGDVQVTPDDLTPTRLRT